MTKPPLWVRGLCSVKVDVRTWVSLLFGCSFSCLLACAIDPKFVSCVPNSQQFMEIEPEMLAMETIVPVYFAVEDDELLSIYEQTQAASASQGSASAAEGELQHKGLQRALKLARHMILN